MKLQLPGEIYRPEKVGRIDCQPTQRRSLVRRNGARSSIRRVVKIRMNIHRRVDMRGVADEFDLPRRPWNFG